MSAIGPLELLVIFGAIAIFFFGKDKVIEWARSLGEAKNAFKEGEKKPDKKLNKKSKKK